MTRTTDFYVQLLTSEHRDRPQFAAVVAAVTAALADNVNLGTGLIDLFDLDAARGDQLDTIGLWVGVSRVARVPITGVYFTWDDVAATGWGRGIWKGDLDPTLGPSNLDDDTYRTVIRAKIAANMWDGTFESMCEFFDFAFGPGVVVPQDNQDMSITLFYDDFQMSTVMASLLTQGVFELKPMGVRFIYQAASGGPILAWDTNTPRYQGWTGTSVWV